MGKALKSLATFAVVLGMTGVGCSDAPTGAALTGPDQVNAGRANGLIGGLLGTVTNLLIPPVTRNTPLANDVVWTFVAGPLGGASSNSALGLSIVVPPGALSSTQTITVTALAGAPVAYGFEPHLTFAVPVVLTQNLRGTSAGGLLSLPLLSGAHFDGDRLQLTANGTAIVSEIVPSLSSLLTKTTTFQVDHFSGWIVASGRGQ